MSAVLPTSLGLTATADGLHGRDRVTRSTGPASSPSTVPGEKHARRSRSGHGSSGSTTAHSGAFLRGLIHSDGCRMTNWTRRRVAGKDEALRVPPVLLQRQVPRHPRPVLCGTRPDRHRPPSSPVGPGVGRAQGGGGRPRRVGRTEARPTSLPALEANRATSFAKQAGMSTKRTRNGGRPPVFGVYVPPTRVC